MPPSCSMELIETHAHLDYPDFQSDLEEVIDRATAAGVTRIVTIGTGLESSRRAVALAERFSQIFAVVGLHPTNVTEEGLDRFPELSELARHPKVVAIGETGIDYHHVPEELKGPPAPVDALRHVYQGGGSDEQTQQIAIGAWKSAQADAFRMQLDLAVDLGLNVVIHQRDSWEDTLEILRPYTAKLRGVFHCFGGSPEQAAEVAALGHLVSFTGIITFKNAEIVRATAASVSEEGYMVETDCPYLAPVPHRGQRAEPAHARLVAEKIAEVRGCSLAEVSASTTRTAEGFFRFAR